MHSLDKKRQASKRTPAPVAKLVDAPDLGSGVERRVGSSPIRRTPTKKSLLIFSKLFFVNGISVNQLSKTTTHTMVGEKRERTFLQFSLVCFFD